MPGIHNVDRTKLIARLDAISDDLWMIAMTPRFTVNERHAVLDTADLVAYVVNRLTSGSYAVHDA